MTALPPLSPLPSFSLTPRSPARIVCLAPSPINAGTFSLLRQGSPGSPFLGQGSPGTPFLGRTPGFPCPAGAPAGPAAKVAAPRAARAELGGGGGRERRLGAGRAGTRRNRGPAGGVRAGPAAPGPLPSAPGGPSPPPPPHRSLSWSSVPGSGCTTKWIEVMFRAGAPPAAAGGGRAGAGHTMGAAGEGALGLRPSPGVVRGRPAESQALGGRGAAGAGRGGTAATAALGAGPAPRSRTRRHLGFQRALLPPPPPPSVRRDREGAGPDRRARRRACKPRADWRARLPPLPLSAPPIGPARRPRGGAR